MYKQLELSAFSNLVNWLEWCFSSTYVHSGAILSRIFKFLLQPPAMSYEIHFNPIKKPYNSSVSSSQLQSHITDAV